MTTSHRLFRADAFMRDFEARVVEALTHAGRPAVILDRTAFYPAAGGQPNDTGALGGAPVLDVIERDDGEIVHVLGAPLAAGAAAAGSVDWARRFDHMQQHSGQHVLSQAFARACGMDTVSVHMPADQPEPGSGIAACTVDLASARLTPDDALRAEDEANRVVTDDVPITAYEVTDAEIAALPLRRAPKVTGRIRIVEVQGYDWSACGGTHVRSTGQIGLIRVTKLEKRGAETRVYFRCGRRALGDYRRASAVTSQLSEALSAPAQDLPQAVAKLRDEAVAQSKALRDAQERLLGFEGRELLSAAEPRGAARVIVGVWPGRDGGALRILAKAAVAADPSAVALLAGVTDKAALVFARGAGGDADMRLLLQSALQALQPAGARGGGTADLAQGGAAVREADRVSAVLRDIANGLG